MDFATIIGFILGLAILLAALLIGGVPVQTVFQPEAMLIVFGGTLTALLIHFSFRDISLAMGSLRHALHQARLTPEEVVEYLSDAAVYIRAKGVLAVEPLLDQVEIPFLQRGLQMIVDNQPADHIRSQLTTELEVQYRKACQQAKVFEAAGGFTPTMGIIGAIVGLIQTMNAMHTPEHLGQGIASAFVATLYGVGAANLFLLPIAGKLKQRAKDEWFLKAMMLEGLMGIKNDEHPTLIREKLEAFIRPAPSESLAEPEAPQNNIMTDDALYVDELAGVLQ